MKKTFVLDTNVLLHNPDSLRSFADNTVILPIEVLEELDKFKRDHDEKGRNARVVIRLLDDMRQEGEPGKGFPLENGGTLKVLTGMDYGLAEEIGLSKASTDNKILLSAFLLKKQGEHVIFVSKDINARIKADALGINSVDFEKQKVDFEHLYSGWRTLESDRKSIDEFYRTKEFKVAEGEFYPNEFCLMVDKEDPKHTSIGRYKQEFGILMPLIFNKTQVMSIRPKNKEQAMAIELLLNNDISLV
ncbi:MAG: PIN domain-containing protein, partial [Candidatus Omnitrophica bacterium]|nr:PIN domain-containing protein [Candidatus Omnitrophota bacterium]